MLAPKPSALGSGSVGEGTAHKNHCEEANREIRLRGGGDSSLPPLFIPSGIGWAWFDRCGCPGSLQGNGGMIRFAAHAPRGEYAVKCRFCRNHVNLLCKTVWITKRIIGGQ